MAVDASIDAVLGEGGMLTGGVSIGRVKKKQVLCGRFTGRATILLDQPGR